LNPNEIVELLLACDELNFNQLDFNELLVDLQNKLIEKEKEWVPENTNNLYQISFRYQSFNILQDYFEGLINNTAEYFLKSHDYRNIEKPILMSILKKDILNLEEINIWEYVIQWGIGKIEKVEGKNIPELNEDDYKELNEDDFNSLKNILKDIIPLIRFLNITSEDFNDKIMPYQKLFPRTLWKDISQYYLAPDKPPTSNLLESRISIDSTTIINKKMILLFASWIDKKHPRYTFIKDIKYKYKLLYRSSKDGLDGRIFHQKCDNINKTLVVGKIQNSEQIVGGYNPLNWNGSDFMYKRTMESFIFNISNRNDVNTAKLSYVFNRDYDHAIVCARSQLPIFGRSDIFFGKYGKVIVDDGQKVYNNINIVNGSIFDELEVFQLIDKL